MRRILKITDSDPYANPLKDDISLKVYTTVFKLWLHKLFKIQFLTQFLKMKISQKYKY